MATRRDARRYGDTTTDNFEKVGNGEDEVDNASGQRSPYTIDLPRDREITPPPPGQHLSPRVPVEIDAETGQALGENLAKGLTAAARRQLQFGEAVDQTGPSERPMLRHLFGLNLPERDQA